MMTASEFAPRRVGAFTAWYRTSALTLGMTGPVDFGVNDARVRLACTLRGDMTGTC